MQKQKISRALISVTNKEGIADFARALSEEFGVEIISTGGTARVLSEAGVEITPIEEHTHFPEMMDGRVKTLHPLVHGGLLARRDLEEHMKDAEDNKIKMIDLVVVNLYEFEKTVAKEDVLYADAIENIDIGGPSMLRSAAKNHAFVTVVSNPDDYEKILEEMREHDGATTFETRQKLALEVFRTTSAYDNAIYQYLFETLHIDEIEKTEEGSEEFKAAEKEALFPDDLRIFLKKQQDLRYGENPHQRAAFYKSEDANLFSLANAVQHQGKELSYNNYLDADAAWAAVREIDTTACVIVKHLNPCGAADGNDVVEAYERAFESDPISAFGGIIAFNRSVTKEVVDRIEEHKHFVEAIIAPEYTEDALEALKKKKNCRVLSTHGGLNQGSSSLEIKTVEGGFLVQEHDEVSEDPAEFLVVTEQKPTDKQMDDLLFAWKVCKSVKSNAILLVKDHANVGMGAGQPNRVNSARIAINQAGEKAAGSVCASDAFFPFTDNIDVLHEAGISAIIQPGGSIRDEEVIAACDKYGIAMVFTNHRHFRH
ncbi:MAG: bifunctional phosphoribosylaminoimidazolecarboxamide formyltransferase/IMP cyclohydrolase [Coriobacteriia bacterium]|nr:bifunctional phosphoribosylaminoimidazolecarboxamide formyltransferase/IMP cyclohydrolase [Coriobacteriia bacterium]